MDEFKFLIASNKDKPTTMEIWGNYKIIVANLCVGMERSEFVAGLVKMAVLLHEKEHGEIKIDKLINT